MDEVVTQRTIQSKTHDVPIPQQTAERIEDDHEIQQWVFNHLPLSEEQKSIMLRSMLLEKRAEKIGPLSHVPRDQKKKKCIEQNAKFDNQ